MTSLMLKPQEWLPRFKSLWREIKSEMAKVSFPNWNEVTNMTIMIIVSSVALAVFLWIADYFFQAAVLFIFKKFGA